jgi:hypothetical protein
MGCRVPASKSELKGAAAAAEAHRAACAINSTVLGYKAAWSRRWFASLVYSNAR